MAFFQRKKLQDRISSQALADFGRWEFLKEQSGIDGACAYGLIANLNELVFTQNPDDRARVVAELHRHAEKGEWEKVGAWRYVREFLSAAPDTQQLSDAGLLAVHRMRVTNLAIHLGRTDTDRYSELVGAPPPSDGFFGPPVFDSSFGPSRQYYFDHAIASAARRDVARLPSAPDVQPGDLADTARAMWDFGLLVYRGPLVVSTDIAFEPSVVRFAVEAASGVDHGIFADRLADVVLDRASSSYGVWSSLGATRFVEEYLEVSAVVGSGYARLLDSGVTLLVKSGFLGVSMPRENLTPRQRDCLGRSAERTNEPGPAAMLAAGGLTAPHVLAAVRLLAPGPASEQATQNRRS